MHFRPLLSGFRHRIRRVFPILAILAAALLGACRTLPPPEGVARASAAVDIEDAPSPATSIGEEAVHFNRFQSQVFEGYGAGKVPPDASGSFQGQAIARAEARRAALRALALQVLEFKVEGKSTLITILGESSDWQGTLERSLEQRATIDFKTREGEPIEMARARIRGDAIFHAPDSADAGAAATDGPAAELELIARRRKAEQLAAEAARDFLYEDLLPFGRTSTLFGTRRAPSETYRKALREELDALAPTSVEFTDDGRCVVEMEYDRAGLSRLDR